MKRMAKLSHYDEKGRVRMVDVTKKPATSRTAQAHAFISMQKSTVASIRRIKNPKGNPLEIARIAGITAAKRTSELIPLCHPLALTHIDVSAKLCQNGIELTSEATATGPTGVEMEALVAASVAAGKLISYPMPVVTSRSSGRDAVGSLCGRPAVH